VEPRDVVLEALNPVEPFVCLRKRRGGHRLDPHKDAETSRLCSQGEQRFILRKEDVGLHEKFPPMGDHRREEPLRERLVGREVVIQKRYDPVVRSLDVGNDMIDGPGSEAAAVDVSRGAKRTGMGAARVASMG